ncbi:methyl-accepting chemotaxis protein [Cohnella candidum]|uniref:Methyl-accepting chemotaxis protein n=1 Tax=Cohnella candidum TaxID=2674991 RepID=A0A3G3K1Y2_9BACL|nr:methyl-accepting chemotaxis protein [Cohnella candidum]AYQ73769.1 methyl-accepting chemotaxis protein [Cohnella candidum]
MLSRLSVRMKLFLMLLIPLVLFAATAVYLLQMNSSNINRMTKLLYDTTYKSSDLVLNADRDMYQALTAYQALELGGNGSDKDALLKDYQENVAQVNDRLKQTVALINEYKLQDVLKTADGRPYKETLTQVVLNFNQWAFATKENIEKNTFPSDKEAEFNAKFLKAREGINQFSDIIDKYTTGEIAGIKKEKDNTIVSTYSILIAAWIVLVLLGYLIIRQITKTVREVLLRTKRVSEGDLRTPPQDRYAKDELGSILQSVDVMTGNIRALVGDIKGHALSVSSASEELAQGARESAASSEHVARNIQEVTEQVEVQSQITEESSKAITEMTVGVQRIAESTSTISDHSVETTLQAEAGNGQLTKLMSQMEQITASIENLDRTISVLTDKSEKIGSITEKITGIANQTNILALNAGIEAARAGEQGKGFAVVAAEIRKLAAGSLESAGVITALIDETREEIGKSAAYMKTTIEQAEQGSSIMEEAAKGFQSILLSIRQVAAQIQDNSSVTEEMSASSEEVLASMEQASSAAREISGKAQNVAAATEEQLALVENIAKASERLGSIVVQLNSSMKSFKV